MTVLPILFSGPMIRAIIEGRKTQTRRVLTPQPSAGVRESPFSAGGLEDGHGRRINMPFYPGDVLWTREAWQFARQKFCSCPQGSEPAPCDDWSEGIGCRSARNGVVFRADGGTASRWRSSIHMPRWASRLTLVVSEVRVQRVQNISEADAIAEGAPDYSVIDAAHAEAQSRLQWVQRNFAALWDAINGKSPGRAWADNPWVAAITFFVLHDNIDDCLRRDAALTALAENDAEEIANG